jgi:endoglucanase
MNIPTRMRRYLRAGAGLLVVIVAAAAIIGGMAHAVGALRVAAAQPTAAVVPTLAPISRTSTPEASPDRLAVQGTRIVNAAGAQVTLMGAADYSLEFSCAGNGHFQVADFKAMRSWGMNAVRITLSSAFWRNLNGSCPSYKSTVSNAIANAESTGLYVILTLQWDAPFSLADDARTGGAQCPLPDATYDVAFWQDLAALYQDDPHAIFDLFSEPHDVTWAQWRNGGTITSACSRYAAPHTYQAIGVPALASKVREVAPSNLIILSGIGWGYDLSGVQAATDSLKNVVFGAHPFNHGGGSQQPDDWSRAFGSVAARLPVIATEFGSYDCKTGYIGQAIAYFQRLQISFVAWAWTPGSCATPSLLADWSGAPSVPYGAYIKSQMLAAAKSA